jgi:molybdate/tungstate transport system substrate-binding protein
MMNLNSGSRFHLYARLSVFLSLFVFFGCSEKNLSEVTVFEAAGFAPVMDAVSAGAEQELKIRIRAEASGTQIACRKVSELGRKCDILISADEKLFAEILPEYTNFRIDFATDEIVLAFGQRAKFADETEKDWAKTLFWKDVSLGRGDENLSPIGYRNLMVWQLQEKYGDIPGFAEKLKSKCVKVVDDVMQLAPLLKTGEVDYAFLYRSMCIAQDIRHIRLDRKISLGDIKGDYSGASVILESGKTIEGGPVIFSLTIPSNAEHPETAAKFIRHLLTENDGVLKSRGFTPMKPSFHGKKDFFAPFADFADYSGR